MIVDSSAILAVLFRQPEADRYETAIAKAPNCRMSAASFHSRGKPRWRCRGARMRCVLDKAGIELVSVTPEHAEVARRAWRRFGKGNHPAGLNFGDCFAYALARTAREPLLFKGEDFGRTDIEAA